MRNMLSQPAVILLIEDDPGDQELFKRAWEKNKFNNGINIVQDGESALDFLYQRNDYINAPRPDLIFLDLNLPRVDGREVLKQIRADQNLKRLIVVVLTTSKQEEDILRSYNLGANSYITKPVMHTRFLEVISALHRYWFSIVVMPPKVGE